MADELWSQDVFSKGELSPYMYGRATVTQYGDGLKTAQNVLTYPTGAAGKRFGTLFQQITPYSPNTTLYFQTFQYLNECIYQIIVSPTDVRVLLEGVTVFIISGLGFNDNFVYNISSTTLGSIFRISGPGFAPVDLTRAPNSGQTISGYGSNYLVIGGASFNVGQPLPVRFTTTTRLPVTTPQIFPGVTYFVNALSATNVQIFSTAYNAKLSINPFLVSSSGVGTNQIVPQNVWNLNGTTFKSLPVYDFNGAILSYDNITFTPSGATGTVTIHLSSPYTYLNSSYIGGAFFGGGGSGRITGVTDTSNFTISVQSPITVAPINGSLVLLAEPAWSTSRGWPQVCSSYQNRALFANTPSLPNGFWASVVNDYLDFGDLTTDDDDAISWFPTSNDINFIRFIVPYRSVTVHTNSGIYSSPLSDVSAITPNNFTLQLQDSTPADVLQPQAIDNQIVVLSGDDAHQMLWDGINNAYTSDIVSVISEQTINNPIDETAFADLHRAGSRYVFIINADGSMAIFQTLISQNVAGFTPAIFSQTLGEAYFSQAASSSDGRCWFLTQRDIAIGGSGNTIIDNGPDQLKAGSSTNFPIPPPTTPVPITFNSGILPTSTPQVQTGIYYYAVGVNSVDFYVYTNYDDAMNGTNPVLFSDYGTGATFTPYPLTTSVLVEELTQDTYLDCATFYNGSPASTISTGPLYNAQNVKMVGDGYGFAATGIANQVTFTAHGQTQAVSEAYIGFPIITIIEPMPLTLAAGPSAKNTTLTKPKHIRTIRFMFNNTIGGTINGIPIAISPFNQVAIGEPPFPARGYVELGVNSGWDDFNNPTYTIYHDDPFNIELLGVFYNVTI